MSAAYEQFSENPRWVLYEGRGGRMRCGEFVSFEEGDPMRVLTNPGSAVPTTLIQEKRKVSPQELCRRYNALLDEIESSTPTHKP